jgi:hypothetical protein
MYGAFAEGDWGAVLQILIVAWNKMNKNSHRGMNVMLNRLHHVTGVKQQN